MTARTNAETLQHAIEIALERGFTYFGRPDNGWGVGHGQWSTSQYHLLINDTMGDHYYHRNEILFNHSFAEALWGKELNPKQNEYHRNNITASPLYEWQWKLTEMVLAEDPIAYLAANI